MGLINKVQPYRVCLSPVGYEVKIELIRFRLRIALRRSRTQKKLLCCSDSKTALTRASKRQLKHCISRRLGDKHSHINLVDQTHIYANQIWLVRIFLNILYTPRDTGRQILAMIRIQPIAWRVRMKENWTNQIWLHITDQKQHVTISLRSFWVR